MFFIYYLYIKNTNSKIKYENIENLTSNKLNVINKNILCISNNEDFIVINYIKNIPFKKRKFKEKTYLVNNKKSNDTIKKIIIEKELNENKNVIKQYYNL